MNSVCETEKLTPADLSKGRSAVTLEAIRILKQELDGVPIVGNLTGPVSTATSLVEPTVFYHEMRKKNADVHTFMTLVTDHLIAFGLAQIEAGADVIAISDPSGTGELLGRKHFEEFTVQYLNRLIAPLKQAGATVIVHICGQMRDVYPQTAKITSDVLSFDSMVPMSEARRELPDRTLMGNVSTYTLEFGEPEKIRTLTKTCVENGSNIISPACGLGMKSPLRNIQSMLEYLKERA
jgi:[methyl-Co(III) methanol-specific corrinoid protein]:coenzyme M methyltransferase